MFSVNSIFNYPLSLSIIGLGEEMECLEELKSLLNLQTVEHQLIHLILWINENKNFVSTHLREINHHFLEQKLQVINK